MILIHGDNEIKSRERLNNLRDRSKKESQEVVGLDGRKCELNEVIQAMESSSLFGGGRLVIIENLISSLESKRKKQVIEYLLKEKSELVVVWERKKIDGRKLGSWQKSGKIEEYKIDTSIFHLVESLRPNNQKEILGWLEKGWQNDAPEMVFFMILRQVRMMIEILEDEKNYRGPVWLKQKLLNQARIWGIEKLIQWHGYLYEIEKELKTGINPLPLKTRIEIMMMII